MSLNPEFAINPDPRCACVLLLDTSSSMEGARIQALNAGLAALETDIKEDALARRRVEIAIVTFGGSVQQVQQFASAATFSAPTLAANGATPMGEAIVLGVKLVKDRKAEYQASGIPYYQPWAFLITDGAPTDEWHSAAALIKSEMEAKHLTCFAVGVEEADMNVLSTITPRAVKLDGLRFRELFVWLSQSTRARSRSNVGDQVALPPVTFASDVVS